MGCSGTQHSCKGEKTEKRKPERQQEKRPREELGLGHARELLPAKTRLYAGSRREAKEPRLGKLPRTPGSTAPHPPLSPKSCHRWTTRWGCLVESAEKRQGKGSGSGTQGRTGAEHRGEPTSQREARRAPRPKAGIRSTRGRGHSWTRS